MKRVLILTSNSGGGHVSVAQGLRSALSHRYPGRIAAVVADPFAGSRRPAVSHFLRLYAPLIRRQPRVWGGIYHLSDRQWLLRMVIPLASRVSGRVARQLLEENEPDLVVSVHPLCHHLALPALRGWSRRVSLVAVLTDLVCVHAAWATAAVDLYLAPTAEAERALLRMGAEPGRIRRTGLPIAPAFGQVSAEPAELRRQLGLVEGRFTVLLVGGAEGAGGLESAALAIARSRLPVQLLVVCGRNRELQRRLQAMDLGLPARIWGFVTNMPELMGAADAVVTKAGSVSLAEAMAVGRPILLIRAIPGQETGNLQFVESQGAGKAALDPGRLVEELRGLCADAQAWATMAARSHEAGRPDAAYVAASEIVRYLSHPPAAVWVAGTDWESRNG